MKKLLNILAVSVGSGLLLGAGLRALEGQAGVGPQNERETDEGGAQSEQAAYRKLAGRVRAMEQVLSRRIDEQQAATELLRLEQNNVEARFAGRIVEMRQEVISTLLEGVERKVADRISRLEEEVAGQSAAMMELRECSLKTERSVHRLIEGIERLVSAQPGQRLHQAGLQEASKTGEPIEIGSTESTGSRLRSLFG